MQTRTRGQRLSSQSDARLQSSDECSVCTPVPVGRFSGGELIAVSRHHFCGRGEQPGDLNAFRRHVYKGRTVRF